MPKTSSEKEFQDRFREEEIIPLLGIDSKEKLEIAMRKGMQKVSHKQLSLAMEVMEFKEDYRTEIYTPQRVARSRREYYTYHGRPARNVARNTREEIIMVRGNEQIRHRDYKTGRFVSYKKN